MLPSLQGECSPLGGLINTLINYNDDVDLN